MTDRIESYYSSTYIPAAHRIGQASLALALAMSLLVPLYLSFVLGGWPGIAVIWTAFLIVASFVGVIWLVEPVAYFPMLGVAGNYMSFLSGNIGNMRLPVTIACQSAIGAEPGSYRAEVAAILGIGVSVVVNLVFVLALVLAGQAIIAAIPAPLVGALKLYTFPALYAAVFMMFFFNAKRPAWAVIAVALGTTVLVLPISEVFNIVAAGFAGIIVSLVVTRFAKDDTA
ncbi:hypothetical protein EV663_10614 [Rhodovulum bhavnagarense]|uniref:Small-conductance mechanosensitive channel n=1 Tax=Rhodovulum bhavnagarense TaxID=992286 RepID=A0A4R2RF56_9RHOB|nr:hypothetical protein [Rhodovulum bhavnagarense]TCP61068.1 hypothetical protein EV663_10614 [Rhodovulum bhavnagarense]